MRLVSEGQDDRVGALWREKKLCAVTRSMTVPGPWEPSPDQVCLQSQQGLNLDSCSLYPKEQHLPPRTVFPTRTNHIKTEGNRESRWDYGGCSTLLHV